MTEPRLWRIGALIWPRARRRKGQLPHPAPASNFPVLGCGRREIGIEVSSHLIRRFRYLEDWFPAPCGSANAHKPLLADGNRKMTVPGNGRGRPPSCRPAA